jgi:hypothetical protein
MKYRSRHIGVYLTGGLGNQLFQFAAALALAEKKEIKIYDKLGIPRTNEEGDAEIFSFNLADITQVSQNSKSSFLAGKSSGYLLRSGIWPSKLENNFISRFLTKLAAGLLNSLLLKDFISPVTISSVGYKEIKFGWLTRKFFNPYLVGYFQSSIWPKKVRTELLNLKLKSKGSELEFLERLAESKSPIIIHVRRGDYKAESSFGLPGIDYYKKSLEFLDETHSRHPIWVFSDEEEEARSILNWIPEERIKYISNVDNSAAASLMAMRLGCAYVIANSTFSWWGAFLSRSDNPLVVAPDPWFTGQDEPPVLIPREWNRFAQA